MLIRRMDASFTPGSGLTFKNAFPYPQRLGANLIAWYAADQSPVVSGSVVSAMNDLSGNGITLSRAAASASGSNITYVADGQNGLPYIQNQQTSDTAALSVWLESAADIPILKWDNTQPFSIMLALTSESFGTSDANHNLLSFQEPVHDIGWKFDTNYGAKFNFYFGYVGPGTAQFQPSTRPTVPTSMTVCFTYDGTANMTGAKYYLNGTLVQSGSAAAISASILFAGQKLMLLGGPTVGTVNSPDRFYESMLVNRVLTPLEIGLADLYLNNKWDLHA